MRSKFYVTLYHVLPQRFAWQSNRQYELLPNRLTKVLDFNVFTWHFCGHGPRNHPRILIKNDEHMHVDYPAFMLIPWMGNVDIWKLARRSSCFRMPFHHWYWTLGTLHKLLKHAFHRPALSGGCPMLASCWCIAAPEPLKWPSKLYRDLEPSICQSGDTSSGERLFCLHTYRFVLYFIYSMNILYS